MTRARSLLFTVAAGVAGLVGCASVSTSDLHEYRVADSAFRLSARAERGFAEDRLVVVVDGVDVASGPFGPDQAAGTLLRGSYEGLTVEARCGHRWRPGLHIGYRCAVRMAEGEPVELDF